jgi:hypothetical protein
MVNVPAATPKTESAPSLQQITRERKRRLADWTRSSRAARPHDDALLPSPIDARSQPDMASSSNLRFAYYNNPIDGNKPKSQPTTMASARAASDTPLPTTETADLPAGSSAPSVVTEEQWKAMAALLSTMYAHRTEE